MHKKKLFAILFSIMVTSSSHAHADNIKKSSCTIATVKDGLCLNIRNSKNEVITKAKAGEELKVKSYDNDKLEIETKDNKKGYIESKYVDIAESKLYVNVDYMNMRSEKNTNSKIQAELKKGDCVIVLNDDGEWFKVLSGSKEGYIKSKYLDDKESFESKTYDDVKVIDIGNSNTQTLDYIKDIERNNKKVREYIKRLNNKDSNYVIDSVLAKNNDSLQQVPHANKYAAQKLLNLAYEKQGCPYIWGAEGDNAFDCSGFTMWTYKNALGINIPRVSRDQAQTGREVDRSSLEAGDLVFFATGESPTRISHVGIYVGDGKMIHAPHTGSYVKIQDITTSFYKERFVKAIRLL